MGARRLRRTGCKRSRPRLQASLGCRINSDRRNAPATDEVVNDEPAVRRSAITEACHQAVSVNPPVPIEEVGRVLWRAGGEHREWAARRPTEIRTLSKTVV